VPTLGALLNARKSYKPIPKKEAKALIAAVPQPHENEWAALPATIDEMRAVHDVFPSSVIMSLPADEDVLLGDDRSFSSQTLLSMLLEANILHLACHGVQNFNDPLKSGFLMSDNTLTIERLMEVPLPHAFFAFLSACETAKGDNVTEYTSVFTD
jgi:CHAT domain-containing protein